MANVYSIYEAKSRLSELLRRVKEGIEMTITERGTPVAKVIPMPRKQTLKTRLLEFYQKGQLSKRRNYKITSSSYKVKGGLKRFLEERE